MLTIAMTVSIFTGCGVQSRNSVKDNYELDASSFRSEHLKLIENNSGIVLPPDSRGQNMLWRGQQIDPSFLAKIEITTNSVSEFSKKVEQMPNQKISLNAPITTGVSWWRPLKETTTVERIFVRAGCFVHIIICQENGRWMVYLEWISA
jgi:hypothetical protein